MYRTQRSPCVRGTSHAGRVVGSISPRMQPLKVIRLRPTINRREAVNVKAFREERDRKTRLMEEERTVAREPAGPSGKGGAKEWTDRHGSEPRKGSDILIQGLEREGVTQVFAYPGGASMEIHQALTRSNMTTYLCRHEQGEVFAAEGYAKSSGKVGVCIATSGPGATNLVTGLADALLDSVPLVAICGQVARSALGTEAFQETPIVEITRHITKHNFMVMDIKDLPRVIKEAFFLAKHGRPGPVLIDVPKDIQFEMAVPNWEEEMSDIAGYVQQLPPAPADEQLKPVVEAIKAAKKPVIYMGGGCIDCRDEMRELVAKTGIPITSTLMGLGVVPSDHPQHLRMLGMHGTVYANYAVDEADLLIAMGARFDDRVTGKVDAFAPHAKIVHMDIDPKEISKNKTADIAVCGDVKMSLQTLNRLLDAEPSQAERFAPWRDELEAKKKEFPLKYKQQGDYIAAEYAIQVLGEETKGEAIITSGVGQHQMWAAQWFPYTEPRSWINSGGLGAMGFGLPAALGCAAAFDGKEGRPKRLVVDIDGDGSFLLNNQELATIFTHKLDVKVLLINNQHLGMVVQWENQMYQAHHAHTYLGKPDAEYETTHREEDLYPNFIMMANSFGIKAKRIIKNKDVRSGIREMLDTPGPYLLEVVTPHVEAVLPMIPSGATFKDIIVDVDQHAD